MRGDGGVQYLHLTRKRQIVLAASGCVIAAWLLAAAAGLAYLGLGLAAAEREIEDQKLAYLEALGEIGEYHDGLSRIVGVLEGNQSLLLSRLAEAEGQEGSLGNIHAQLKDTEVDRARAVVARQALKARLEEFEGGLQQLAARDATMRSRLAAVTGTLEQARAEGAQVAAARERLDRELRRVELARENLSGEKAGLEREIASLQGTLVQARADNEALASQTAAFRAEVQSLDQEIAEASEREAALHARNSVLEGELESAITRADRLQGQRDFFEARADKLEVRLDEVSEVQNAVVARLTERTLTGIDMIERVVAMTGLNINELIEGMDIESLGLAQGGPYLSGDFAIEADPRLQFQSSVALLDQQMDRWEALQEAVRAIPLASPLDHYRVTSTYGERTDPFNGRRGMHYGLDLSAPMRTPVLATAPGTVVFAGWKGHYGRVVELDHGNGIRTLYGHLRKILVKAGQEVAHREKIGLLGNSGRSTGAHVHYEVLVNGKPHDPANFVMAGRNAFKG